MVDLWTMHTASLRFKRLGIYFLEVQGTSFQFKKNCNLNNFPIKMIA